MAEAFGAAAAQVAPHLGDIPAIVASEDAVGRAYFEMASRRATGEPFAGMLLVDDRPSALVQRFMQGSLRGHPRGDVRSSLELLGWGVLNINGKPFLEIAKHEPELANVARDMMRLCDLLIVRSAAEYKRYQSWFESNAEYVRWIPKRELGAWSFDGQRARRIVVWAAGSRSETTALIVAALESLHAEIVVVSAGGEPYSERATYLLDSDLAQWREAVATADCIVDAAIADPSWAYAFAERGVPLAYASTSGAGEWIRGGKPYLPWAYRTILEAVAVATALGPTTEVRDSLPLLDEVRERLEATRPRMAPSNPLVSVIIPTYNRRQDLLNCSLRSVLEQRHQNLEIIIVNDGGEKVGDLAALDARIKVFDREVNVGANEAINFGLERATGKYAQLLGDDDALYPDHLARLVEVLERTGNPVAHGNTLIRFEGADATGTMTTYGYNATTFSQPVDSEDAMASSPVAGQAMLMRMDVLRRVGFYKNILLADQELQIRLSKECDFLHVPRFSSEFLVRSKDHNLSRRKTKDVPNELRAMYDLHPSDSDYVAVLRDATLQNVGARHEGFSFPPVVTKGGFEM